ncbi:MAG: hypothetical protein ACOCVW_03470 [bacterium]
MSSRSGARRTGATTTLLLTIALATGPVVRRLEPGDRVRPVDERAGWYVVRFCNPRGIGWVSTDELIRYDRLVRGERDEDERGNL